MLVAVRMSILTSTPALPGFDNLVLQDFAPASLHLPEGLTFFTLQPQGLLWGPAQLTPRARTAVAPR